MRRLILPYFILLLTIISCERPLIPEQFVSDADGNLIVSVFQIEQLPFAAPLTRTVLSDHCSRLSFAVYDTEGKLIKQLHQKTDDAGFGAASFAVGPGTYQVVVIGHSSGNPTMTNPKKIKFENKDGFSDTFLFSGTVVVADEDEETTVQADLKRIASLCRVDFTDPVPQEVTQLRFQYKGGSGAFDAATGLGSVNSTQTLFFPVEPGQTDCSFDLYTFLHDTEGTLHLQVTAYNDNADIIHERMFEVPMTQRQITRLTGPYFSGTSGQSITVVVGINAEWEGEQTIDFNSITK